MNHRQVAYSCVSRSHDFSTYRRRGSLYVSAKALERSGRPVRFPNARTEVHTNFVVSARIVCGDRQGRHCIGVGSACRRRFGGKALGVDGGYHHGVEAVGGSLSVHHVPA